MSAAPVLLSPSAGLSDPVAVRAGAAGRRPRGRPRGAATRVIREEHCLGRPHVAFLRACFQGLDPRVAWVRYLGRDALGVDRRHIENQRRLMLAAVLRVARAAKASLPPSPAVDEALHVLEGSRPAPLARALPSLAEWVAEQQIDTDMFSEAELLELFREHFGLDTVPDEFERVAVSSGDPVRALNALEGLLLEPPRAGDPVSLWFSPRMAAGFKALRVESLGQALAHIRQHGEGWFRRIWGVGRVQARQLLAWLETQSVHWPATLGGQRSVVSPTLAGDTLPPRSAPLRWEMSHGDSQRLTNWLEGLRIAPATRSLYRRELERYVWWCRIVRGQAPEDTDEAALREYMQFLAAVPPDWVCRQPVAREDIRWRPFRGSLDQRTRALAVRLVARYLGRGAPARVLPMPPVAEAPLNAVQVIHAAQALKESARARRLRALLALWLEGDVTFRQLAEVRFPVTEGVEPPALSSALELHVSPHTWQLCRAHRLDALSNGVGREAALGLPRPEQRDGRDAPAILRRAGSGFPSRANSPMNVEGCDASLEAPTSSALGRVVSRFLRRLACQHNMAWPDVPLDPSITAARWRSAQARAG